MYYILYTMYYIIYAIHYILYTDIRYILCTIRIYYVRYTIYLLLRACASLACIAVQKSHAHSFPNKKSPIEKLRGSTGINKVHIYSTYIPYTIHYMLYTIYYILYTIYYILYTVLKLHIYIYNDLGGLNESY